MSHLRQFQGIPMSKLARYDAIPGPVGIDTRQRTEPNRSGAAMRPVEIPSMRGLCKEEDYAFLGLSEKTTKVTSEEARDLKDDWRDKKEERVRRRLEREQLERERLQEIEESKKEKEQQWRTHVEKLTSSQEKTLQDRLARLRRFRVRTLNTHTDIII
ncbi:U2 small nuclear ribonucleoprotein auxiliary factor 35 kDa subunit-related protein 1-like [Centropristis striata]|uniref:U2 small nuclear ribonucleoprotein auxiliary factor 35 kDa subunit-related protein 1-like n=1 Tax=Centropristis striata TaxID=184440 RepID=UPI0027E104CC|nr:U2 small nuclear ribonucleoprotein auxiliary factor 35 kDa subunit-related protein 1-like [Centropristis striata]